jgi:hypothetical protein
MSRSKRSAIDKAHATGVARQIIRAFRPAPWLISSPGRLSVDRWIAVRSGLLDGVSAGGRDTRAVAIRR